MDEDETLITSLLFLMTLHFRSGLALSKKDILLTRSYIFFFFKNSDFIVSSYRKSLILPGYDINKCERLCIGVSAFNLAREFCWMSHGVVTRVGSLGTSHCYMWAYDFLGNPVTY